MKKEITLDSGKIIKLNTDKIPTPLTHEGSRFIETTILANADVYVDPPQTTSNSIRTGSTTDPVHVDKLEVRIENKGCEHEFHPPYAYKEDVTCKITGKKYQYRIRGTGNHRKEAFDGVGASHWIYNVYEPFDNKWAEIDTGFKTNDHSPQLSLNKNAITNNLSRMVKEKRWGDVSKEKLEEILRDYLQENCSSLAANQYHYIVKNIFHQHAEYTDHVEYTPDEAAQWISNYTDREVDFKVDKNRNVHGSIVGEGYEKKRIITAIMKFGETKLPTEFVAHVKQPLTTDKTRSTTPLKRKAMIKVFEDIETDLDSVFEYKQKHGKYPFSIVSFIAQDRKNKENFEQEQLI